MIPTRIIPCLDIKHGRVVKGVQFSQLKDSGDPLELALSYQYQTADELVILDIAATPDEKSHRADIVSEIRQKLKIPLTVGGGIRTIDDVRTLLEAGADKVAVNTKAVTNPELLQQMSKLFGCQCTILALDAKRNNNSWKVCTNSGKVMTDIDAIEWAQKAEQLGTGEILLTSWDRDGSLTGYDLELLKAMSDAVNIPIIASGGAANAQHMIEAVRAGASAVLAASIFHNKIYTVQQIKNELNNADIKVRIC